MHADAGVGGAGAPRAENDAGAAGQFAVGVGHVGGTTLLPADDEAHAVAALIETLKHRQVALTGHAKGDVDTVADQRIDQDLPAVAGLAYNCSLHGE